MADSVQGKNFKPKANILVLLGEELIKSPVMAIYELIKNSYDADATKSKVVFNFINDLENAKIIVEDNGTGITEEVLENVWLEPGTAFRKPFDENGTRRFVHSPIHDRIPMGEKGVGRFAVHKLGSKIKLITRPASIVDQDGKMSSRPLDYELTVQIDWSVFNQSKYLEDVQIEWTKNTDESSFVFQQNHGTLIEVSNLKESWTRGMARQLKRQTLSMLSPKNDASKFNIELDFKNEWLNDFPDPSEILKQAPYKFIAIIDPRYKLTFEYEFNPVNNETIGSREIKNDVKYDKNVRGEIRPFYRSYLEKKGYDNLRIEEIMEENEAKNLPFGGLMLELYSYDLDPISLRDVTYTPDLLKKILRDHSGVKVFKNDLRVYDYGDAGNDWLGLDLKRVQNKEWFSNNQNIGFIYLDSQSSGSLVEKTNREGFIDNSSFDHFLIVLDYLLTQFKTERQHDRERWINFNRKGTGGSFENRLQSFKAIILSSDLNDTDKKQKLIGEAEKIEKEYEDTKNTLLIPAGVGLTASIALHEIEKLIPRMEETSSTLPINAIVVKDQILELKDYVGGILTVLRRGGDKSVNVADCIHQAVNNYKLKLRLRRIDVVIELDKEFKDMKCEKRYLITMLMNLIDNSVYWLDTVYKENKIILIKTYKLENGGSILIADNGPGFKDTVEDIVRPFFSRKEDGIGIGMYLVDTIMLKYGKLNILHSMKSGITSKMDGAAVELIFNKNL